jgi:hypothetical protein
MEAIIRQARDDIHGAFNIGDIWGEQLPELVVVWVQLTGSTKIQHRSVWPVTMAAIHVVQEVNEIRVKDAAFESNLAVHIGETILNENTA